MDAREHRQGMTRAGSGAAAEGARTQAAPRCFVYILGSRRGRDCRTYVGWTLDLERRLAQHNGGSGARSTRGRDWLLLYAECCATRGQAMSREWHLKRARAFRRELRDALVGD
jgi:putative endonuclease